MVETHGMRRGVRWLGLLAASTGVAAAALLLSPAAVIAQAPTAKECIEVVGTFTNQFLGGPDCPDSPIAQCTRGELKGDINGTYTFNFYTSDQTGEASAPVLNFTGQSVVVTNDGTMTGQDYGTLRTTQYPQAAFSTHLQIDTGTGAYEGGTGRLNIQGASSFETGQGSGTYDGNICKPLVRVPDDGGK